MNPLFLGAIDAGVLTDLGADVGTLSAAGFTLLGLVLAATIGIKLVRKFAQKST